MRPLIDTHILIWWLEDATKIPAGIRKEIEDRDNEVFVSVASIWEIAIKRASGKLDVLPGFEQSLAGFGFMTLPILPTHAIESASLPKYHKDPFDRLLVGQARIEKLMLATVDEEIAKYDVPTIQGTPPA